MTDAANYSLAELSNLFSDIGARLLTGSDVPGVLKRLTELTVKRVPGAEYAGITVGRTSGRFSTVAATGELVHRTDAIQYELGAGPCVDAVVKQTTFNARDLRLDERWPEFGRRAVEATGIVSMLSMRLFVEGDGELIAGLNAYSHAPEAFDETSESIAVLLATHGALAVASANANEKARNLHKALDNSREIGMAMGIIMATHKLTREQAFDILRVASQHTHQKIAEIAAEVTETGVVPDVPMHKKATSSGDR
jgi:hypothetical protein